MVLQIKFLNSNPDFALGDIIKTHSAELHSIVCTGGAMNPRPQNKGPTGQTHNTKDSINNLLHLRQP